MFAQIIFKDGYNFNGMEIFMNKSNWFKLMYSKPNFVYVIYILLTSISAGICGVISQSISFISKKYSVTYLLSFFVWMILYVSIILKWTMVRQIVSRYNLFKMINYREVEQIDDK